MSLSSAVAGLVVLLLVAGMLAMGTSIGLADLGARLRHPLVLLVAVVVNAVLLPALAVGLVTALPVGDPAALALVLVAASPGGGTGALLALHARGDVAHAVTLQALLAATSLVSVPLWMTAYAGQDPSRALDVGPLALALVVFQLLPLLAGIALRARSTAVADRSHVLARRTADGCLLTLVVVLVLRSGDDLARNGMTALAVTGLLVVASLLAGSLPVGAPSVRRATAMTTTVRNLSMALLAARFADEPDDTALVVLAYGLVMYLVALAAVLRVRRGEARVAVGDHMDNGDTGR